MVVNYKRHPVGLGKVSKIELLFLSFLLSLSLSLHAQRGNRQEEEDLRKGELKQPGNNELFLPLLPLGS